MNAFGVMAYRSPISKQCWKNLETIGRSFAPIAENPLMQASFFPSVVSTEVINWFWSFVIHFKTFVFHATNIETAL